MISQESSGFKINIIAQVVVYGTYITFDNFIIGSQMWAYFGPEMGKFSII